MKNEKKKTKQIKVMTTQLSVVKKLFSKVCSLIKVLANEQKFAAIPLLLFEYTRTFTIEQIGNRNPSFQSAF